MDRARRLRDELEAYQRAGADVVVVGQGDPERAAVYAEAHEIPVPVLVDPDAGTYERYGLLEGTPAQILFDAPDEFLRREPAAGAQLAAARRASGRPLVDNPWLLPGEFVIDTAGTIRLAYRYQYCEDFPDSRVLVAAIREASGEF